MKKFKNILIATLLCLALVAPAQAEFQDMWTNVYSWDGSMGADGKMVLTQQTTNIQCQVLQRNTTTEETLYEYGDNTYTSLENPIEDDDFESATISKAAGVLSFRVDPGEANDQYVDLICNDMDGGFTKFVEDFDKYTHTIVIDERPNIQHHGAVWYKLGSPTATYPNEGMALASGTSEVDAGITFLPNAMVQAVAGECLALNVITTGADMTVGTDSNGTNGDADGFLVDLPLVASSTSASGFVVSSLASTGAFLDNGTNFYPYGKVIGSDEGTLTYTVLSIQTGTGAATTSGGYIHYFFTLMR